VMSSDFNLLKPKFRKQLIKYVFDINFIVGCRAFNLRTAYTKMSPEEKAYFLGLIDGLVIKTKHSALHYEFLKFYRDESIPAKHIEDRITALQTDIYATV